MPPKWTILWDACYSARIRLRTALPSRMSDPLASALSPDAAIDAMDAMMGPPPRRRVRASRAAFLPDER